MDVHVALKPTLTRQVWAGAGLMLASSAQYYSLVVPITQVSLVLYTVMYLQVNKLFNIYLSHPTR